MMILGADSNYTDQFRISQKPNSRITVLLYIAFSLTLSTNNDLSHKNNVWQTHFDYVYIDELCTFRLINGDLYPFSAATRG
jgi:hypothetical protein